MPNPWHSIGTAELCGGGSTTSGRPHAAHWQQLVRCVAPVIHHVGVLGQVAESEFPNSDSTFFRWRSRPYDSFVVYCRWARRDLSKPLSATGYLSSSPFGLPSWSHLYERVSALCAKFAAGVYATSPSFLALQYSQALKYPTSRNFYRGQWRGGPACAEHSMLRESRSRGHESEHRAPGSARADEAPIAQAYPWRWSQARQPTCADHLAEALFPPPTLSADLDSAAAQEVHVLW